MIIYNHFSQKSVGVVHCCLTVSQQTYLTVFSDFGVEALKLAGYFLINVFSVVEKVERKRGSGTNVASLRMDVSKTGPFPRERI